MKRKDDSSGGTSRRRAAYRVGDNIVAGLFVVVGVAQQLRGLLFGLVEEEDAVGVPETHTNPKLQ